MEFDLARRVIDEARATVGADCTLGFYIRGEPTLHPRLPDMIRYARDRGMRRLLLSTNLARVDRRLAGELLGAGLSELRLSIDGPDAESFERARRGAEFSRVCAAVTALHEERRRLGSRCHFRLHAAIDRAGFRRVPAFVRRWGGLVDSFKFTAAVNQGGLFDPGYALGLSGLRFAAAGSHQIPCRILYNYAGVTWDGKITSCCVDYDEHFVIGRIEEGIDRAFRGRVAREMRAAHLAGRMGPLCGRCGFANALVDWFEDEVNQYVERHRRQLRDPRFDRRYFRWLRYSIAKFDGIANTAQVEPRPER
jgi:hypothetical protein